MSDQKPIAPECLMSQAEELSRCQSNEESSLAATAGSAAFGIIDPEYARIYTVIRLLAWQEGYAAMMHGSFTRDLDIVAVPWTDKACEPEHLVRRVLASNLNLSEADPGKPGSKPHGRLVWTLMLPEFGDPRFVDFSIMPPNIRI
jgi:hypothetical protein